MKKLISLLVLVTVFFPVSVEAKDVESLPNGFRKATWGMTRNQVKATESGKIMRDSENALAYKGSVGNADVLIFFFFVSDKLVRGKYSFLTEHTNKNEFISDFERIKSTLKDKYGDPQKDETFWSNELYKDEPENWGMAIAVGDLSYYTTWENENTDIVLALDGDNYEISLVVEYSSKALHHLAEEAKKKEGKG